MPENLLDQPVAVIGANSMVGSRFCDLTKKKLKLIKADFNQNNRIDITSKTSIEEFFKKNKFKTAILFSAYTDVDGAEAQRGDKNGSCWKINVDGVQNVVDACRKFDVKLIFISTDFVFGGENGPYDEADPVGKNPDRISWYGITKIEAEKYIQKNLENYLILRISYPYRGPFEGKDDVLKRVMKMAKENKLYPMFSDQFITPTFVDDLAPALLLLLEKDLIGIFHIVSPKVTTHYQLAKELLSRFKFNNVKVEKGSLTRFLALGGKTPRPVKGGLLTTKISKLGFTPTSWDDGIRVVYKQSEGNLI